jgi:hypothetical protein
MAGRPDPASKSGLFGALRQSGGGNSSAGLSFGGGGSGAAFPQRGGNDNLAPGGFTSNAGFGFNAGPQSNSFQQLQGGNGNNAFPQPSQGGLGFAPSQNFTTGGGFSESGNRRGGQGNGNQRQFRNSNYRGGRNSYKPRSNSNRGADFGDSGTTGLAHKKANQGESTSANATGGSTDPQAEGKKKAKKESCYRCGSNGNLFFECTAILCEYCEQVGHKPDDYQLLSAPKPQLVLHGISDEKLMFFECPITKSYRPKLESTRLGLLSVTGGELSIPGIIAQLQRLVPVENFTWECHQVGHNVFKVTFPDKDEIERLAWFGTFHVPNSSIKLDFQQCVSSMEPTSKLPEIWILMAGIPQRRIGDFLAMWSLGTLFGKTLKVDMKYTREKGVLRILVGCLDYRRIPTKERIYIADGFYDIFFEVEAQRDLVMITEDTHGEDPSDQDGHGNNDDGTSESQKNLDAMETDVAHGRNDQDGAKNASSKGPDINKLASDFSSGVKFSPRVKRMMEQSKIEIATFIAALPSAAAAAEESPNYAAASPALSGAGIVETGSPAAAAGNRQISAATTAESSSVATSDARAENSAILEQLAVEAQMSPDSATEADLAAVADVHNEVETQTSSVPWRATGVAFSAAPPELTPAPTAETDRPFRAYSDISGAVLQIQKMTSSPLGLAKETAPLSPITRDDGCFSQKSPATTPAGCKKGAVLGKGSPRLAATPSSPPIPYAKSKKMEEAIAFGGISEKTASPVCSSQRVKMQHNGDATQMERATQLAKRRIHAITPGTRSNLSFSKFSDFEIETRATTLGVSLGSNASETKRSISALKQIEEDRRITYLKNNLNENLEEERDCSILCTANQLSSDLAIEDCYSVMTPEKICWRVVDVEQ